MEAICVKLDKDTIKVMDRRIKEHHYGTRTDFVREAIREKLRKLNIDKAMKELSYLKGSAKKKVTSEEYERVREEAFEELARELK